MTQVKLKDAVNPDIGKDKKDQTLCIEHHLKKDRSADGFNYFVVFELFSADAGLFPLSRQVPYYIWKKAVTDIAAGEKVIIVDNMDGFPVQMATPLTNPSILSIRPGVQKTRTESGIITTLNPNEIIQ